MSLTPGRGGEGRAEAGITDWHVLGRADEQEEMAEDGGSGGRQGWMRLYHHSGQYSILSRFPAGG